jgi:AAA family ATP:ADP antiporter
MDAVSRARARGHRVDALGSGGDAEAVSVRPRLSPLERGLRLFTDVRPGEGGTAIVLFVNVFLILCAYYLVKPLRDGWIAVSDVGGLSQMELKAYASFGQSLLLACIVSGYARLSARWPRRTLITRVTLVCIANLAMFWLVQPGLAGTSVPGAGIAFYLWVGMFGVFVVAQFWAFAADLYDGERGERLLPLIAIGATAGAAFGSLLTELLVRSTALGSGALLLVAIVPLAASIGLTRLADGRGPLGTPRAERVKPVSPAAAAAPSGSLGVLGLIARHRYLAAVALVALFTNWVNTNGENVLFRVVQEALSHDVIARGIADKAAIRSFVRDGTTAFYGDFFFWVNTCALVAQAFLASRLLRYGGFAAVLLMLPVISLVSYTAMALVPLMAVVRVMKVAENGTNYSINNTARQVLWLPTTAEMKYQAKPAIDALVVRIGDGLAALTVLVGVHVLDVSTQSLLLANVVLVVAWLAASVVVVREQRAGLAAAPASVA